MKTYTEKLAKGKGVFKGKDKGKVVPVLNQAPRHEGVLGRWRYSTTHS
jgi:hypothetical protein